MFKASQPSDMGSIPIARSISLDDSIVLTPLNPLISVIKPGVLVPGWSQRNKLVPTSDGRSWQLTLGQIGQKRAIWRSDGRSNYNCPKCSMNGCM